MKENVGRNDQTMRSMLGPLLLVAGYLLMGGRKGRCSGLMTMIAGALVTETAITRTCPVNEWMGIDTSRGD